MVVNKRLYNSNESSVDLVVFKNDVVVVAAEVVQREMEIIFEKCNF